MHYYAYISQFKVTQLYDQLTDFSVDKKSVTRSVSTEFKGEAQGMLAFLKAAVSAGGKRGREVEEVGHETEIHKLAKVIEHIAANEKVLDLGQLCRAKAGVTLDAFCYVYEGSFYALGTLDRGEHGLHINPSALERSRGDIVISKDLLITPALCENSFKVAGPNNGSLVSDMTIISSDVGDYTLRLACSYKYFSDMGQSWREGTKEYEVHPHSGNHHFFEGSSEAYLRGIVFLNGIRGDTVMGTPLCLQYANDPKVRI